MCVNLVCPKKLDAEPNNRHVQLENILSTHPLSVSVLILIFGTACYISIYLNKKNTLDTKYHFANLTLPVYKLVCLL